MSSDNRWSTVFDEEILLLSNLVVGIFASLYPSIKTTIISYLPDSCSQQEILLVLHIDEKILEKTFLINTKITDW